MKLQVLFGFVKLSAFGAWVAEPSASRTAHLYVNKEVTLQTGLITGRSGCIVVDVTAVCKAQYLHNCSCSRSLQSKVLA